MKYFLFTFLFSPIVFGNEIYIQIIKNKPSINKLYARHLATIIQEEAPKFKINPRLFTAILMQESSYIPTAKNCKTVKAGYEVCTDYSISQIHYKTVKLYNFDKDLLLSDVRYGIKSGLRVLSDFQKRYEYKENDFWTRYNSSNPKARLKYKERVMRWL